MARGKKIYKLYKRVVTTLEGKQKSQWIPTPYYIDEKNKITRGD